RPPCVFVWYMRARCHLVPTTHGFERNTQYARGSTANWHCFGSRTPISWVGATFPPGSRALRIIFSGVATDSCRLLRRGCLLPVASTFFSYDGRMRAIWYMVGTLTGA